MDWCSNLFWRASGKPIGFWPITFKSIGEKTSSPFSSNRVTLNPPRSEQKELNRYHTNLSLMPVIVNKRLSLRQFPFSLQPLIQGTHPYSLIADGKDWFSFQDSFLSSNKLLDTSKKAPLVLLNLIPFYICPKPPP